jgi:hypothetical protein
MKMSKLGTVARIARGGVRHCAYGWGRTNFVHNALYSCTQNRSPGANQRKFAAANAAWTASAAPSALVVSLSIEYAHRFGRLLHFSTVGTA